LDDQGMGGPSWPDLQCLVRRKPAAASSAGRAEAADGGGGQHLAKTLTIPHLAAIGTRPILTRLSPGLPMANQE